MISFIVFEYIYIPFYSENQDKEILLNVYKINYYVEQGLYLFRNSVIQLKFF